VGVNEDQVTGSAHTMLIPFWAEKLGKVELLAKQVSARGGLLHCKFEGDRVKIGGKAVTFLTGEFII
jgi:predicted PhzF superfamily epimerase YddE/YHI9